MLSAKVTKTGYRRNSPDVNNPVNIIPSNIISMKDVAFPVLGIDSVGNYQIMQPENDYVFKGAYVIEFPMRSGIQNNGGWANQTGTIPPTQTCTTPWGAIGTGISGLFQAGAGIIDTSMADKTNKQIASAQGQVQKCIAAGQNVTAKCIQNSKNTTCLLVNSGKDQASIEIAEIQGQALDNAPAQSSMSSGTVVMIVAGMIVCVAVAGLFLYASKK